MALPKRVQENAARAAALIKQNQGDPSPPQPAPASQPAPAGETAESLAEKLAAANAEVERLKGVVAANGGRASSAERRAQQAEADLKRAKERATELEGQLQRKVESGQLNSVTDDERKLVGDDTLKVIVKAVRELAGQEVDAKMRPLTERFDSFQKMTEAQYEALLDHLLPDFDQVNNDPQFIAWLQGLDPATGRVRHDLLRAAHSAQQGYRTVEIFRAFKEKREIGAREPTPAVPPGLESRIDPPAGQPTPPPPPDPGEGKIILRSEIKKFYREKREGLWRGKEDEAAAFEAEIFKAQTDGRVR